MTTLTFKVNGPPVSWKRAGRDGRSGRTYTDPRQEAYQALIRLEAQRAIAQMRLQGTEWPLGALYDLWVWVVPYDHKHGDASNYVKIVEDALQGRTPRKGKPAVPPVAFVDDKQVVSAFGEVCAPSKACGIDVRITVIGQRATRGGFTVHVKPRKKRAKKPKVKVLLGDAPCGLTRKRRAG